MGDCQTCGHSDQGCEVRTSEVPGGTESRWVCAHAWTERKLLDRLRERLNPGTLVTRQWAYAEHVRAGAGWEASTIDALAVGLWRSTKHEIHAYEVKISRGDLRRELADPGKAAVWTSWVDRFLLVAPRDVVTPLLDQLPPAWGVLVPQGAGLRQIRAAELLTPPLTGWECGAAIERSRVAALLAAMHRNTERVRECTGTGDQELASAVQGG